MSTLLLEGKRLLTSEHRTNEDEQKLQADFEIVLELKMQLSCS
jgi:hypothetical protein